MGRGGGLSVCCTQKFAKIASEHVAAWRFGHEDLVKTNFFVKVCKKAWVKLSIPLENFKMSLLLIEI